MPAIRSARPVESHIDAFAILEGEHQSGHWYPFLRSNAPSESDTSSVDPRSPFSLSHTPSPSPAPIPIFPSVQSDENALPTNQQMKRCKRPPNAFFVFRSDFWRKQREQGTNEKNHCKVSQSAADLWNSLSADERAPYVQRALEIRQLHAQANPGYRYSPVTKKDRKMGKRKAVVIGEDDQRGKIISTLMQAGIEEALLSAIIREMDEHDLVKYWDSPLSSPQSPNRPSKSCHGHRQQPTLEKASSSGCSSANPAFTSSQPSLSLPTPIPKFVPAVPSKPLLVAAIPTWEVPQITLSTPGDLQMLFDFQPSNFLPPELDPNVATPNFSYQVTQPVPLANTSQVHAVDDILSWLSTSEQTKEAFTANVSVPHNSPPPEDSFCSIMLPSDVLASLFSSVPTCLSHSVSDLIAPLAQYTSVIADDRHVLPSMTTEEIPSTLVSDVPGFMDPVESTWDVDYPEWAQFMNDNVI